MKTRNLVIIGERDPVKPAHAGIEASVAMFRQESGADLVHEWLPTAVITPDTVSTVLRHADGVWCAPGSPYVSTAGALTGIRFAREHGVPFLGTCGGFQHALMEFAENVPGHARVHEEMEPGAEAPLISKLSCSLAGAKAKVVAVPGSGFSEILGGDESVEEFNCNYGLNDDLQGIFEGSALKFVAFDEAGQLRAFRLAEHPFFLGTLFQPERRGLAGAIHPVVRAFFRAMSGVRV